jgi:hypothetical protein
MSKTIKIGMDGFVLIEEFSGWIDVSKVKFYSLTFNEDKSIVVKFYNKNKKLVKPYGSK